MSETKQSDNKRVFEVNDTEYAIVRPNAKQSENASMEYNRVFGLALKNGALLRESLEKFMREQNLWDDEKEKTYTSLLSQINEKEKKLALGGIKLSEAREMALDMKGLRLALQSLISERNSLDVNTAQGQAENARFNYLLVQCLVYNDSGRQVYASVTEYQDKQVNGDPVGVKGAEEFANMYFGLAKDYDKGLPENKFLKKFNFVDEELRLINKDGRLVDYNGKLVDENGRYIDEDGNFVNFDGEPMTEEGDYAFEPQPFLDDDGKPLDDEGKEKPKPKRGRPKKAKAAATSDEEKESAGQ